MNGKRINQMKVRVFKKILFCSGFSLDENYVHIQRLNSQWPKLFETYFLSAKTRLSQTTSDDDLVFYVTSQMDNDFHHPLVSFIFVLVKIKIPLLFRSIL